MGNPLQHNQFRHLIDIDHVYEILIGTVYRITVQLETRPYNNDFLELQNVITYRKEFVDDLIDAFVKCSIELWNNPYIRYDLTDNDNYDPLLELHDAIEDILVTHGVWVPSIDSQILDDMVDIIDHVMDRRLIGQLSDLFADVAGNLPICGYSIKSTRCTKSGYKATLTIDT